MLIEPARQPRLLGCYLAAESAPGCLCGECGALIGYIRRGWPLLCATCRDEVFGGVAGIGAYFGATPWRREI
jgi:hypothetical protein